jgi:hypothetical protein
VASKPPLKQNFRAVDAGQKLGSLVPMFSCFDMMNVRKDRQMRLKILLQASGSTLHVAAKNMARIN